VTKIFVHEGDMVAKLFQVRVQLEVSRGRVERNVVLVFADGPTKPLPTLIAASTAFQTSSAQLNCVGRTRHGSFTGDNRDLSGLLKGASELFLYAKRARVRVLRLA
jgi:hypothetical protein